MLKSKHFLLFLPLLSEVKCFPVLESTWGVPGHVCMEPSQWIFFCSPSNYHTLLFEPIQIWKVKKIWQRQSWNQSRCCTPLETGAWSRFTNIHEAVTFFLNRCVWLKSSNNRNTVIYTHPVWHQQQITDIVLSQCDYWKTVKLHLVTQVRIFFNFMSEHSFYLNFWWIVFVSVPHVSTSGFSIFLLVRRPWKCVFVCACMCVWASCSD